MSRHGEPGYCISIRHGNEKHTIDRELKGVVEIRIFLHNQKL